MIMTQTLCGNFLIHHFHNVKLSIIIPPHVQNKGMKGNEGNFAQDRGLQI